jgi:predicted outer membrane protein
LTCALATAEDAKPNDAQIAHIAYTADQIDINAAELARPTALVCLCESTLSCVAID